MCGIGGIFDFAGRDVSKYLKKILLKMHHRGPDGSGVVVEGKAYYSSLKDLIVPEGCIGIGFNRLKIVGEGNQPIPNESRKLWLVHNGEIYNYLELKRILRQHTFRTTMNSEVILHAYEENKLEVLDGNYAFAIYDTENEQIRIYRDFVGIRPVFYCYGEGKFAFASERKALRSLCDSFERLTPGNLIIVEKDGFSIEKFETIEDLRNEKIIEEKMVEELEEALRNAIQKRRYEPVGLLFSGGIDSTILAKLAIEYYRDPCFITVGLRDSVDIKRAKKVSKLLGFDLEIVEIDKEEVLDLFRTVITIIDEPNVMKGMIGVPIYAAMKRAKEIGLRVVLVGQGADELFGGYAKYLRAKNLEQVLLDDLKSIHEKNLERDDHCAMANSIEIRVPYLDKNVIKVALRIPSDYKVRSGIRKWILRMLGKKLNLPKEVIMGEKKAIQYGSGVANILKKQARKHGKKLHEIALEALTRAE